jgi:uncharacterized protein (DUF488 family)
VFATVLDSPEASAALDEILALARTRRVALLCFEREPQTCHRNLVAEELVRRDPGLTVSHA